MTKLEIEKLRAKERIRKRHKKGRLGGLLKAEEKLTRKRSLTLIKFEANVLEPYDASGKHLHTKFNHAVRAFNKAEFGFLSIHYLDGTGRSDSDMIMKRGIGKYMAKPGLGETWLTEETVGINTWVK
jgi:uncharacterized protein (DUF4415 family)